MRAIVVVIIIALAVIAGILLFVELPWGGSNTLPLRGVDFGENFLTKSKHTVLGVPLDKEQCYENLALLHDIFGRVGITFYLTYGTALGIVRGGDLLDWDDDLDIGIPHQDMEKLVAAVPQIKAAGFVLAEVQRDGRFMCFLRGGEKVDIDISKPGCFAISDGCKLEDVVEVELDTVNVRGRHYYVLTQKRLAEMYGADWRTPKTGPGQGAK